MNHYLTVIYELIYFKKIVRTNRKQYFVARLRRGVTPHFVPKIHDEAKKECNHKNSNCHLQSLDSDIGVSVI